jgi:nucleotide-binding universal stress UspA family protein
MYRHILIPTDGSELAEHAVTNGLSLAKSVGAKVSVIVVEEPFNWFSVSEANTRQISARCPLCPNVWRRSSCRPYAVMDILGEPAAAQAIARATQARTAEAAPYLLRGQRRPSRSGIRSSLRAMRHGHNDRAATLTKLEPQDL